MPKRKPLHRKPSHAEIFESDRVSRTKLNKFTQNVEDNRANLANNPEVRRCSCHACLPQPQAFPTPTYPTYPDSYPTTPHRSCRAR